MKKGHFLRVSYVETKQGNYNFGQEIKQNPDILERVSLFLNSIIIGLDVHSVSKS